MSDKERVMVKLSVVVPIYNVEKYIGECIESICSQTLKELQVILVDDGSPDNSGKICDEYAAKDDRIEVIHKKNGGVGAARNDGLAIAKGEYIIFVDSDDYVPAEAYEKMYNKAKETDADIVIADIYRVIDGKDVYSKFYQKPFVTKERDFIDKLIQADFYKTYCPMPAEKGPEFGYGGPWNKIVKRDLLIKNNITFDVSVKGIFDDIIYTAYILAAANCIAYINEPVYYYRILDNSITQTYKSNMLEINNAIFESWNCFMKKYGKDGQFEKSYYANVVRRMEQAMLKYFFNSNNKNPKSQVKKELKNMLISEPYVTAVKNVEKNKLTKGHRYIVKLAKTKSPFILKMGFCGKNKIKKLLGK